MRSTAHGANLVMLTRLGFVNAFLVREARVLVPGIAPWHRPTARAADAAR